MATVLRFRHTLARMTAVLGDHGMSHCTHSSGLHDGLSHQVCLQAAVVAYVPLSTHAASVAVLCLCMESAVFTPHLQA